MRRWTSSSCACTAAFLWRRRGESLLQLRLGAVQRRGRVGMDGHGRIAQHRLRTRGGDRHVRRFARPRVDHRILEVPEVSLDRFVKHLVVAHGRLQERVPVHQPLAAVDQPLLEQVEERAAHGPRRTMSSSVNRVPLPVAAAAHLLELAEDSRLVFVLPFPDALDQLLAAQVVAGLPSSSQSRFSTTACVAMPAWSVPGIHSVLKPCIRFMRIRMSCSVLFRACPRCSAPVTFGGGMTMEYGRRGVGLGVEVAAASHSRKSAVARQRDRSDWEGLGGESCRHGRLHPVSVSRIRYSSAAGRSLLAMACRLARPADPQFVAIQLVFKRVDQRHPTGFDDVLADADGAPDCVRVAAFDDHADAGGGAGFGVDDADLVVDQVHVARGSGRSH